MIIPTIFKTKMRIRILYKSGNVQEFWCYSFEFQNGVYRWNAVSQINKPLVLGADDIVAIWQTGGRLNIFTAIGQILRIKK